MLETSHMSLAKPETNDDGQLPTGWQLLTYWHFTAETPVRHSCGKRGKEANISPASISQPER